MKFIKTIFLMKLTKNNLVISLIKPAEIFRLGSINNSLIVYLNNRHNVFF